MKSSKWMLLATLVLLSGLMAAQSPANLTVEEQTAAFNAYVPFQFVVAKQTLPAGHYQIQRLMGRPSEADEIGMIVVRNNDKPVSSGVYQAVVTRLGGKCLEQDSAAQLVFVGRSGERYLSEVRITGEKANKIANFSSESEPLRADASEERIVAMPAPVLRPNDVVAQR